RLGGRLGRRTVPPPPVRERHQPKDPKSQRQPAPPLARQASVAAVIHDLATLLPRNSVGREVYRVPGGGARGSGDRSPLLPISPSFLRFSQAAKGFVEGT